MSPLSWNLDRNGNHLSSGGRFKITAALELFDLLRDTPDGSDFQVGTYKSLQAAQRAAEGIRADEFRCGRGY